MITPEKAIYIIILLILAYKFLKGDFNFEKKPPKPKIKNGEIHWKDNSGKKAATPGGGYKVIGDRKYNYTYIPSELEKQRKEKRKKTDPKKIFKEPKNK